MEWVILNPPSIHETFGLLGYVDGEGNYNLRDSCEDGLSELQKKLENDGQYFRIRRSLGLTQVVGKDLMPLLIHACSEAPKLLPRIIRLLAQVTLPIECLINQEFTETEEGQQIVYEIESLLRSVKIEFSRFKATEAIIDFLKSATLKTELTIEECDQVSDGILLLRNILHISIKETQVHNQILWNLFAHSFDKVLLHLMTCDQKEWWGISLVQLISLIYKDQHVNHLQKLLALWLENSTDSSEDNESNTSPKCGVCMSPMLTSDPTSDSSDTGGNTGENAAENGNCEGGENNCGNNNDSNPSNTNSCNKPNNNSTDSENILQPPPAPVCKYYTKVKKTKARLVDKVDVDSGVSFNDECSQEDCPRSLEDLSVNKVLDSTSSNEEENNGRAKNLWKSTSAQEKQKKKLHKRMKRSTLKQHHHPTEEDISHILREFTVHFLLKGYGSLVSLVENQLSKNSCITVDKSHFLWLITYFLKFASQLELDLELIRPVLSFKILSYLTFEAVVMCENLSVCKDDLKPHLRRMHLVVTSLREFVQCVETYSKMQIENRSYLNELQKEIIGIRELRFLFLLLIRAFKPGLQSKQYLQDLITTNHNLLLLLERISTSPDYPGDFQMLEFVQEFANPLIMQQYGHLLEDFAKNGEFVNDCVFTMMHHVAGDLNSPDCLFQPLILKTFSNIWEVEFEIRDDWADLVEYVIQRFMKSSKEDKRQIFKSGTSNISEETGFTKEDIDKLYYFYSHGSKTNDPIGAIMENYHGGKTRESVLNQLLHQRIIGYNQFLKFLSCERFDTVEGTTEFSSSDGSIRDPVKFSLGNVQLENNNKMANGNSLSPLEDVNDVLGQMRIDGLDVKWIQEQVLEVCHVKLALEGKSDNDEMSDEEEHHLEPIPHHFCLLGKSVPLVPWTKKQESALQSSSVIILLHKLGFHLGSDTGKLFPRIPHFWGPDVLYSVATRLGPIGTLKFDDSKIGDLPTHYAISDMEEKKFVPTGNFAPAPYGMSSGPSLDWMCLVQKSKMIANGMDEDEKMDECASLTACPPSLNENISENVSMMSDDDSDGAQ